MSSLAGDMCTIRLRIEWSRRDFTLTVTGYDETKVCDEANVGGLDHCAEASFDVRRYVSKPTICFSFFTPYDFNVSRVQPV